MVGTELSALSDCRADSELRFSSPCIERKAVATEDQMALIIGLGFLAAIWIAVIWGSQFFGPK